MAGEYSLVPQFSYGLLLRMPNTEYPITATTPDAPGSGTPTMAIMKKNMASQRMPSP